MLMVGPFTVNRSQVIRSNTQITLGAPYWAFGAHKNSFSSASHLPRG